MNSHLLICGDFNYHDINWSSFTCNTPSSQMFLDSVQDIYLYQHILEPTRYRVNTTPHTLDLIFTNEEGMVSDIQYLPGIGHSDHVCIKFNLVCYRSVTNNVIKPKYNEAS